VVEPERKEETGGKEGGDGEGESTTTQHLSP